MTYPMDAPAFADEADFAAGYSGNGAPDRYTGPPAMPGKRAAATSGGWPTPDLDFAAERRAPAPAFPLDVFGGWADWLGQSAAARNVPPDYVATGLLTASASLLGNARWGAASADWREPPTLYAVNVGDPSSGKSHALDPITGPLRKIETAEGAEHDDRVREWEEKEQVAQILDTTWKAQVREAIEAGGTRPGRPADADPGPRPERLRLAMTDTTVEKLAIIHRAQPRGTLLYRDELAGWLHHLDRYNAGDRPFWLECYGGRSYSVERVKHPEPIVTPRLSVSVLGTIQPDKLNSLLMTGDDDGMLARFVCVWPDPVPLARATPAPSSLKIEGAFERLLGLAPVIDEDGTERPFYVALTDEAADELFAFRGRVRAWEADAEGLAKSHLGKFPGLALRVATVLAHLDWALDGDEPNGPREITADQFGRAVRFVGDYLRPMAARVYGEATTSAEVAGTRRLAGWIKAERKAAFTRTDVLKAKLPGLRKAAEVKPALDNLTQAAWVQCERQKTSGPPRDLYTVNPAVLT